MKTLAQTDPTLLKLINKEAKRQEDGIELIASENYASKAVMEALGSPLTNKYSEGYVGKRYYGGNEVIDEVEALAIERCKKLFDCEYVNVQPLSGSPANAAVYFATLKPGDKVLGLQLTTAATFPTAIRSIFPVCFTISPSTRWKKKPAE